MRRFSGVVADSALQQQLDEVRALLTFSAIGQRHARPIPTAPRPGSSGTSTVTAALMGQQRFRRDVQVVGRGTCAGEVFSPRSSRLLSNALGSLRRRCETGYFRQKVSKSVSSLPPRSARRYAYHGPNKNIAGVDRDQQGIGVGHRRLRQMMLPRLRDAAFIVHRFPAADVRRFAGISAWLSALLLVALL